MPDEVQLLSTDACMSMLDSIFADRVLAGLAAENISPKTASQRDGLLKLAFSTYAKLQDGTLQAPQPPEDPVLAKAAALLESLSGRRPAVGIDTVEKQAQAYAADPRVHDALLSVHYHQAVAAQASLAQPASA